MTCAVHLYTDPTRPSVSTLPPWRLMFHGPLTEEDTSCAPPGGMVQVALPNGQMLWIDWFSHRAVLEFQGRSMMLQENERFTFPLPDGGYVRVDDFAWEHAHGRWYNGLPEVT